MNADVKARWVAALRSGEYKKGAGNLRAHYESNPGPTHCCLGVLCELSPVEGLTVGYLTEWDDHTTTLPPSVQEWAELDDSDPTVPFGDGESKLSDINDGTGLTFDQIADLIEANL